MKVSDIMKTKFLYLDASDPFSAGAAKLLGKNRCEIPVLSNGRFIGMFALTDVAAAFVKKKVAADAPRDVIAKLRDEPVSRHMKRPLFGCPRLAPDWDIMKAFMLLARAPCECLPVIDRKGRLLGVVFAEDLKKRMVELLEERFSATPGRKVREDRYVGGSDTTIDEVLRFVQAKGTVSAEEVAGKFSIPVANIEEYALSLEKNGLLKIEYTLLGRMRIKRVER